MITRNFTIRKSDIINRRMFIIGAAKLIIFGGLIARLFSLVAGAARKEVALVTLADGVDEIADSAVVTAGA